MLKLSNIKPNLKAIVQKRKARKQTRKGIENMSVLSAKQVFNTGISKRGGKYFLSEDGSDPNPISAKQAIKNKDYGAYNALFNAASNAYKGTKKDLKKQIPRKYR